MRDLTLADRRAKGEAATAELEKLLGGMTGRTIEVHAGALYVDAMRRPIERRSGRLTLPMAGLGIGQQLRRYDELRAGNHARM